MGREGWGRTSRAHPAVVRKESVTYERVTIGNCEATYLTHHDSKGADRTHL